MVHNHAYGEGWVMLGCLVLACCAGLRLRSVPVGDWDSNLRAVRQL